MQYLKVRCVTMWIIQKKCSEWSTWHRKRNQHHTHVFNITTAVEHLHKKTICPCSDELEEKTVNFAPKWGSDLLAKWFLGIEKFGKHAWGEVQSISIASSAVTESTAECTWLEAVKSTYTERRKEITSKALLTSTTKHQILHTDHFQTIRNKETHYLKPQCCSSRC